MRGGGASLVPRKRGFSLTELLVTIAIVTLLASFLLPALARAKGSAKSTACKSNLRQLGIALELYVGDFEKYGGKGGAYFGGTFAEIRGTGMNWLHPYIAFPGNPDNFFTSTDGRRSVLSCPAFPPRYNPGIPGGPGQTEFEFGYAYNELGTGWRKNVRLGLGPTIEIHGRELFEYDPRDQWTFVTPGDIRNPAEMIAIGDSSALWLTPNYAGYSSLRGPHSKQIANVLNADGHVAAKPERVWNEPTEESRSRWNNDNLPHPETW
jgi:prepilin-type N-terminal cleavage/methylation domain-containing protein/prepilin-type processing-associated H-X9-DG protein